MRKILFGLTLLAAGVLGTMAFNTRALSNPSVNLADYPYMNMIHPHSTNLSASACANSAQDALKKSGFTRVGSGHPGYGLYGYQGSYVAAIAWNADLHSYFIVVAGPEKATADGYLLALENNAKTSFEK